jgi:hypothetical protein
MNEPEDILLGAVRLQQTIVRLRDELDLCEGQLRWLITRLVVAAEAARDLDEAWSELDDDC